MEMTFKAPDKTTNHLIRYWADYFSETPTCTCSECFEVAIEVDPYFPYLDDYNRCEGHCMEGASIPGSVC